ncbi:MAG: phosphoribosyltransferase [Candidatus Moranbacteria bacterium]|nr:phosphoribosyltransferase [Candidatus Moranbacteria bacterium]
MFQNRQQAAEKLAKKLIKFKNKDDVVIIALPRGGIILGQEIAGQLNAKLDITAPRKISAPGNKEFAIGAITEQGDAVLDEKIIQAYSINQKYIEQEINKETREAQRRLNLYRGEKKPVELKNKTVIIVDDGIATGSTIKACLKSIKNQNPRKIVIAVPVAPPDTLEKLKNKVDEIYCLITSSMFFAVGQFYQEFNQVSDQEVIDIMQKRKSYN